MPELDSVREALGNEAVYRRARHMITEDERTVVGASHIRARQFAEVAAHVRKPRLSGEGGGGVSAPKHSDGAPILLDAPPQQSEAAPPTLK
ncbi:hypothetical protein PR002_g29843 [Phytophthora rubi]|uniref:Uncharacterized protein n=1 Tax=Phytophthora rubi TaxID=129364 RepID=A0A6A3GXM8_9STRA|nr:hypothetical protein PR002_g29843 [Phytophthora rubi]